MMTALLDASVRAVVIAALVGLALQVWRVRSGAIRHAAWSVVVITMLALPLLRDVVPTLAVPFPMTTLGGTSVLPLPSERGVFGASAAGTPSDASAAEAAPATATPGLTRRPTGTSPTSQARSRSWASLALALWFAGALVLAARMFAGWQRASRLVASARLLTPVEVTAGATPLYESPCLAAPIAVGIWQPRIVLPLDWQGWSPQTREAVLLHEGAHASRRDAIVSLVAAVNTCVFWFHPLAWWLQRQVSECAEQACDDRVVRETGSGANYADVLLQMAHAVRRHGARIHWAALGIGGHGRLSARIDRALRGDGLRQPSRLAQVTLTLTCATAIVIGVACRQAPAPLKEDPAFSRQDQRNAERNRRWAAARDLTREQLAALEQKVASDPDDLDTTQTLLTFYRISGHKLLGWDAMLAGRLPHVLRVIERHPDSQLVSSPVILFQYDPAGYARARALWMATVQKPDVSARVLGNAAAFFTPSEKAMAETLLLHAERLDPKGPQPRVAEGIVHLGWKTRLGELYAQGLMGANGDVFGGVVNSVSTQEAHGPFAAQARQILDSTSDVEVLTAAGRVLLVNARLATGTPDVEASAAGETYLTRALQLDSSETMPRQLLAQHANSDRNNVVYERMGLRWPFGEVDEAKIALLTDADKLWLLPNVASSAFSRAELVETKDPQAFARLIDRAEKAAVEALDVSERLRDDPTRGRAIYQAHLTLALVAIRRGDTRLSVRELQHATEAPSSPELAGFPFVDYQRIVNYLLRNGERDSVIAFLEKASTLVPVQREQMLKDATAIRNGIMPRSYQAMFARTPTM